MPLRESSALRGLLLWCVAVGVTVVPAIEELRTVPGPMLRAHAASDADDRQVAVGRTVYLKHCARCHGEKGEGIEAPSLIDETASRLQSYPTAAVLYRYVRFLMPVDAPDSLPDRDYWAVVAYLLVRNGVIPESVPVGPETAEQIVIKR